MALAAPTAFAPRKECEALEAVGDIPGAVVACREVLTRTGAIVSDYARFVDLVLQSPQPLPDLRAQRARQRHRPSREGRKGGQPSGLLRCKVALRFEDRAALEQCRTAMAKAPFNDPTVISIKWGLAVREHDRAGALALVEEARKAGLESPQVQRMIQTTHAMATRRLQRNLMLGGAGLLVIGFAFFGARVLSSNRRRGPARPPA